MEIIAYLFFDITLNFLEKNMYADLLIRCDDACVITPYLFIYINYLQSTHLCMHVFIWKIAKHYTKQFTISNYCI